MALTSETNPAGIRTDMVRTNGINLHAGQEGSGELVILLHGFPQCWYVWRHQIPCLADAGFQVCAPDQRGYGLSDRPPGVEDYNILKLTADVVGLADELGAEKFTVVGQDWGCTIAWNVALLYPNRVRGVFGFSVPYVPRLLRNWTNPSQYEDAFWYVRYFMQPGIAEAELEADITRTLMWIWYAACAGTEIHMLELFQGGPKDRKFLDGLGETPSSIPGNSKGDIDYCLSLFHESGFRGPLNYYRNLPRQRELTPWLEDARILVPAMFAYGDDDTTTRRTKDFDRSLQSAPVHEQDQYFENLLGKAVVPGAGHWPMVEQPDVVNDLLLTFLRQVN